MKKVLFLVTLLLFVGSSKTYNKIGSLDTEVQQLYVGDQVISTLGYFKFSLEENNCQFRIWSFQETNNKYVPVDTYINRTIGNCKSIKIEKNKIVTDTGNQFLKLSSPDFEKTWLTIDDQGSIRFMGVSKKFSQSSIPSSQQKVLNKITDDKIIRKNIFSNSQIKLNQTIIKYTNENAWAFQISNNILKIYKSTNNSLIQSFSLENIYLDISGVYDINSKSSPFAIFQSALIYPRCSLKKSSCQIRAPFTIQMNSFWPIVKIYDQQKYLIAQYALGQSNSFQRNEICPAASFLYKGMCLKNCPQIYYQKIDGKFGQCVLTCEEGSIVDDENKRCSCSVQDVENNKQDTKMIKKCERQWNQYFFGCDCSPINKVYDRISLACQSKCPERAFADSGICFECGQKCLSCSRDNSFIKYLKCDSCEAGYTLMSGQCVLKSQQCGTNCQECNGSQCTKCANFYSLLNGVCLLSCGSKYIESYSVQKGSVCVQNSTHQAADYCYVGCTSCNGQNCLSCAPGYVLFISPLYSSCKLKTAALTCSGDYAYQAEREICYLDNRDEFGMSQCKSRVLHCQACEFKSETNCLLCQKGFYLHGNQCLERCPSNYAIQNNVCEKQIPNCQSQSYKIVEEQAKINSDLIKNSNSYKKQIANGQEPANDLGGYSIYARQYIFQQTTNNQTFNTISRTAQQYCLKCRKGYGLSQDESKCLPCPSSCQDQYCYFANENSCYKPTIKCTFLDENDNCMPSCPDGRYPEIDQKNQTRCLPKSLASVNDYLKIDSSYYLQEDQSKIYYFILDRPVQNSTVSQNQPLKITLSQSQTRRLVESQDVSKLDEGQYYSVRDTNENAVAISFDQTINKFRTAFGFTLANSVYGAEADYTHNQWMKEWLAHIGYVLSWVILIVHCLYIGNSVLYKADNLIIFCQTIYFFSFVKLLVGNTLAQYYYGWSWMHMGFWPNYFKGTVPNQYEETQAPLSFKLATLDGNFIRNCGFAISLFITFLALWAGICLLIYLLNKFLKKSDIWYSRIAKDTLIAAVQLLSMVIYFFSVTQLMYGKSYPQNQKSFHTANFTVSIIFISFITIYMIIRFFYNPVAGLYMFKKLSIALILVDAFQIEGFLALLIALQIFVAVVRYFLEKPRLLRQKLYMLFETGSFILSYFLLFLVLVPGVNVLIITVIIFTLLLFLISDLMDVYLQSRNQFYEFDFLGKKYDNQQDHQQEIPDSERKMKV